MQHIFFYHVEDQYAETVDTWWYCDAELNEKRQRTIWATYSGE